jgi:hypothetical protein
MLTDLKKCDDLEKVKSHIETFENYIADMALPKLGMD